MTDRVRIAVIDDHPMFRTGLVASLRRFSDFEIVSVGGSADEALKAAGGDIDILLLDIGIPGDGIEAGRRIAQDCPSVQVIYLTGSNNEDDATTALATGASGYVLKGATGRELANAIRTVHHGDPYITPELGSRMLARRGRRGAKLRPQQTSLAARPELSPREQQVLDLATQGLKNQEIASALRLSVATIKYHIGQIVRKWGVRTRVEAIVIHAQKKVVSIDPQS